MCTSCGFYGAGELLEEHRKVFINKKNTKYGTCQPDYSEKQTNKQTMYIIFAVHQEHIFTCVDCDNILETSASLEKHIEDNHPAQCAQCQDEFRLIFLVFQIWKVQPLIQLAGQRSFLLLHKKDDGSIDQQSNKAGGHLFQMWYFSCFAFLHLCSS